MNQADYIESSLWRQNIEQAGPHEQAVKDAQGDAHANEDPDTSSIEATNSSQAVQVARNQSFRSNPELGLPRSNLNTSGTSVQSDRSDQSEKSQSDPEVEPPEDSFLKMARLRSRKPGKKAMVPRKWATIFAR